MYVVHLACLVFCHHHPFLQVDPDDTLGFSIFPFSRLAVNQENHELLTLPLYEIAEEGQPPKDVFDSYGKASTVSIKISAARTAD